MAGTFQSFYLQDKHDAFGPYSLNLQLLNSRKLDQQVCGVASPLIDKVNHVKLSVR